MRAFFVFIRDCWNSFFDNQCYNIACALTYYTFFSVVPVLAVAFGIALALGLESYLKTEILAELNKQPELAQSIINFSYSFLQRVQAGTITAIGTIALLWTCFTLLVTLENTCNAIWHVHESRSIKKQIVHYIGLIFLAPLLFVLTTSSMLFLTAHITHFHAVISLIISILIIWTLFFFIFLYMPHRKVPLIPALVAAITAGTLNQLWYWAIVKFQVGITSYGAIYGSFAALPLFLIWIQISWVILFVGVVISKNLHFSFGKKD